MFLFHHILTYSNVTILLKYVSEEYMVLRQVSQSEREQCDK